MLFSAITANAQKVRNIQQLKTVADTLIAQKRYAEAYSLCDKALGNPKLCDTATYARIVDAGVGLLPSKKDNYSNLTVFISILDSYALLSDSDDVMRRFLAGVLGFCVNEGLVNTGFNYCDKAERFADCSDSLNWDFRGLIDYTRGALYSDLREWERAVTCYGKSVDHFDRAGNYGQALFSCIRGLYHVPKVEGQYSLDYWNSNLDRLFALVRDNGQLSLRMVWYYYIAKSQYFKSMGMHREALQAWDSSFVARKRYNATLKATPRLAPRNMECYNMTYRIEYLQNLGMEEEIERIAEFAKDSSALVPDDYACLLYLLGKHYGDTHRYQQAYPYLRQSYDIYRESCGESSSLTLKTLLLLLRYSIATQHYDYAMEIAGIGLRTMPQTFSDLESASYLDLLEQTSALELLGNNTDSLDSHMIAAEKVFSRMLIRNFGFLSDAEFSTLWSRADISCSHLLQMATEMPEISDALAKSIYRTVLTQKTLYFVSQNHLKR